jgi:hypothetical protein
MHSGVLVVFTEICSIHTGMDNDNYILFFILDSSYVVGFVNSCFMEKFSQNMYGLCRHIDAFHVDASKGMVRLCCLSHLLPAFQQDLILLYGRVWARKLGQLWYEIFDFSANISPEKALEMLDQSERGQFILAMHPHGIIPLQAVLWTAYCDQYLKDPATGRFMYGFGAVADVVGYLPILRNILGWLSGGSADYKTLKDGLVNVRPTYSERFSITIHAIL